MTVRVSTVKGVGAGRYYTDRLPGYYIDGDEPPGRWWGRGAGMLGLGGEVGSADFEALMSGIDPASGTRLGRRYGDKSVRGFDATFSAPKSVSVLFGLGDPEARRQVTEAHERAVEAVLGWVEQHASTRMRQRGHVVCVDAEGIVVGLFRHHTSRLLDPQLHTHAVIANRVKAPDGRWLALDARTLKMDQRTLSGLYHAALRTELTRRLGVQWHQPDKGIAGIAEIAGIDRDVLDEFSQRTQAMQRRLAVKLERFRDDLGREPTGHEQWRLDREAALDSRPRKPDGHSADALRGYWRQRLEGLGHTHTDLLDSVTGRQHVARGIDHDTAMAMAERAIEALSEGQSAWRPAELVRELAVTVPTDVAVDPAQLTGFLQRLADHIAKQRCVDLSPPVPDGVPLRRDGRPVTEAPIQRQFTTQGILDQEHQILEWATRRIELTETYLRRPAHHVAGAEHLGEAQREACDAVAGVAPLVLVDGPAGAGKTTALAPAIAHLQQRGSVVFGVAPTAAAAEVLATETAIGADTLDKLLYEYTRPDRAPQLGYDLPFGATVIVDEAGTVSTPKLAELTRLADEHRWRVVLVGDPRQFTAVGRGGMFAHLVDTFGAIELDRIHRFTQPWERQASLRLRRGDPTVLNTYDKHDRLHGGSLDEMQIDIVIAWQLARDQGQSVALMANSTDTVARLNHLAQLLRIQRGELDPTGPVLQLGEQRVLVGDEVVTRRNDRTLRTDTGKMIKNRDHWTIEAIAPDGGLTLTGDTGAVSLSGRYVAEHVELGYAQTSHATQGRTVDIGLVLIDAPTDNRGIYTPMTRGRHANHAYVATTDQQTALDVLTEAIGRDWIDQPAVARQAELDWIRLAHDRPAGRSQPGSVLSERTEGAPGRSTAGKAADVGTRCRLLEQDRERHHWLGR